MPKSKKNIKNGSKLNPRYNSMKNFRVKNKHKISKTNGFRKSLKPNVLQKWKKKKLSKLK